MVHFPNIRFMARSMKSENVAIIPVACMSSSQGIDDTSPNLSSRASSPMNASGSESMGFLLEGVGVIGHYSAHMPQNSFPVSHRHGGP